MRKVGIVSRILIGKRDEAGVTEEKEAPFELPRGAVQKHISKLAGWAASWWIELRPSLIGSVPERGEGPKRESGVVSLAGVDQALLGVPYALGRIVW